MLVTRHTQLLAQFPSYSFFSFEHALPSSPALTTPAWSRHVKYASLVSQHRCRFSRLGSVESSFLLENHPMFDDSNEEAESGPSSTSCGKTGRSEFPHDSVFSRTSDRRTALPSHISQEHAAVFCSVFDAHPVFSRILASASSYHLRSR